MKARFLEPEAALAMERRLFDNPVLGGTREVWATRRCLVVPKVITRAPGFEAAREASARAGWPVYERITGGGIVPQGPGIVNVSLAYPADAPEVASLRGAYGTIGAPLIACLGELGLDAGFGAQDGSWCDGDYNVLVEGRKLAGTAQRRGSKSVLVHLVMTVDADLEAGVDAVNRLAAAIGRTERVRASAHVNWRELAGEVEPP